MRALCLQKANVAQADQPRVTCGRRLSSDYAPLCLENKLLAQSSTLMPQPGYSAPASSLQPSRLSSTSSSLLAASLTPPRRPSPLLSTENRLLTDLSPGFSFSLASSASVPNDPPLFTSLAGGSLLERFAGAPPFLHHAVGGKQKSHGGGDEGGNEVMRCSFEETSVQHSEEEDILPEDEEEEDDDALVAMELPAQESGNEELEQTTFIKQEEFAEIDRANENIEEELQNKKYLLLNAVCCSLVNKSTAPGQKDWDAEKSVWTKVIRLSRDISVRDPQFLLKVAVYTRQELNIRITANFLLALAANLPSTKPHVRRYFCAAVQLPSDWLEVVRIYSACFSRSLPSCLKKAMADKFKQFNEYQLAKYNTRKHRCKHNRNRPKSKKPSDEQMRKWANLLRSDESILKKFLKEDGSRAVVDKKQKEFSMKKMIEKFHIKEPAEHVMAILGKKYPADPKTFTRSGIKGSWDRERAGQRMKLKEPETWERLLRQEGNKAATWEKLIDNKSLPFMAMLRNLRNMITKGISEAHHKKILSRLTNKKAVVQSRQFPTRFLAAYKVIMELNALALQASKQALPPVQEILKGILGKIPKSRRFKSLDWETTPRSRIRVTMGVPFIYRLYKAKKTQLMNANKQEFTVALLDRYRGALETAVQLSCRYNVPPLPGRTVVVLACEMDSKDPCQKLDFCLPPEPGKKNEEEEEEESGTKPDDNPTVSEAVALLSLMIASSAEDCRLCLHSWRNSEEVKLESDVLLDNVRSLLKQMKAFSEMPYEARRCHCLTTMLSRSNKVDNIVVLTDRWLSLEIQWAVETYRTDVNDKALVVQIHMEDRESELVDDRNCVKLYGFSDQILRFVAERGSSRLLDHVEHLDRVYNIPPPEGARAPETANCAAPIPASPKLRWRSVRVFVSSTFRDMHAERDVLVRAVFPELRRRAASRRLHLQEVELRWGVTEEESGRAAELCLSEVCRSQMLVGILGERYGLVPPRPLLPDLPQHSWLASAPAGLSITEMEIRQFQALYPDAAQQRMFCYFRDPNITNAVPVAWRSDFAPESKEAESKMASLKRRIRASDVKVTENYCCEWGGAVEGKPYLKHLEVFGEAVLEDLWAAVETLFVEEEDEASSDATEQEVHQEALRRQFSSRAKLLSGAVEVAEQARSKGGLMVVEAGPGEGKTVFMAALADGLRNGVKSRTNLACDIIAYSTAASQSARSVENLLRFLVRRLRRMNDTKEASPLPRSYKDLLLEFHSFLSGVKREKAVVLLIDGVDLLQDGRGQLNSDWIPQQLPQGVCLVLSITSKAPLLQTLAEKRGAVLLPLGPLTVLDRKEMVKKELDSFGKKLSDSAFNNQLQTLVMKKGAASPLYLHLACEDLRNFASFDKLKESLQDLPQSLSQLVHRSLARLCTRFRGERGLRWALAALAVSSTGLRERDLYSVLNACSDLSSRDGRLAWQDVLRLSRKPEGRLPMATFTRIAQSLQSLIGPSQCRDTDDLLALTNPEVRRAFEDFLLPTESDRTRAHLVLAAHLWALADPQGTDTFLLCEANSVMQLPAHLNRSGQVEALHSLLSSYYFLYANVRHGLLHHLREAYSLCDGENTSAASLGFQDRLEDCRRFLRRHAPLLSSWPALFLQQALNEPPETAAHIWARGLTGRGGPRVVEWLNNDDGGGGGGGILQETNELVSTFSSVPTCLVGSSDGELMVVGTGRGMLHLINTRTGHEVKSLVSSCDGISSCVLLKDGRLATTSFDGRIEIWDIANGCRTALIQGHANVITGSDLTADRKHLVTVSLDFMLKVWSSAKGHEVAALPSSSPLNCVTFDPEGHLLAAGCWNGNVIVWNWLQNRTLASLTGHRRSVRSVSFSPSSSMLCSGSISGEVRLWSVPSSTCVGCFQAHRGAAEALAFLDGGSTLLSAGSDHLLQLWSGGLGRSVAALKSDDGDPEPPLKKLKSATSEPAALCVAVNGDCAAVGYHGDGIKLFSLDSGKKTWDSGGLDVSTLSLLWVALDAEHSQPELLLSAGSDKRVRVWRRADEDAGLLAGLEVWGTFNVQPGAVQAMAQNATYLATASDESSIALCSLRDLALGPSLQPHALLSGHSGAVTCLAFSPDGGQLLSGGKDKALLVWDVSSSPAVLSKSLLHCHKDWITSCAWTPDCAISSSSDGALCSWDLQAGRCLREINLRDPLASICCLGGYVVAGGAGGTLHVWNWETNVEICHVAAHEQSIHHCSLLPRPDQGKKVKPEEMCVFTASEDGSVQLWKPLQVEHFGTLQGHSGAICGVVLAEGLPEFLSVSEDRSLRRWKRTTERPGGLRGPVAALCFSRGGDLLLAGYESGLLEVWRRGAAVGQKQVSDGTLTAICSMPGERFAVSYEKLAVDVWKVVWDGQRRLASLVKVSTYAVEAPVIRLNYCSVLMGVSDTGTIFDVTKDSASYGSYSVLNWNQQCRILGTTQNDERSMWLLAHAEGQIRIGFIFAMGPKIGFQSAFGSINLEIEEEEKVEEEAGKVEEEAGNAEEEKGSLPTAGSVDKEFVVCGDANGNMWFNEPPDVCSWSSRKPAHSDRISVLKLTERLIISASHDGTVKLWDRNTKKQVGMFACGGPVLHLEVNPVNPNELVCGDGQGKIYFLSWKE